MSDATTTLSAGDRVGNYQVLGLAGAGGMGVVYRALDLKLERTVALKFLPHELVTTSADRERFRREARTASALDHPNIGVIHGIEETGDGRAFIVMAYYEGETVARKLLRGPLPAGDAVDIAIQMTRGLAEAHARAVIHRDIKPSNVIITQQNIAKIVDFGLARTASPSLTTQSMGTGGTFGYMSPEQSMGQVVDQRTDIWALGVVLTEMVTGRNPFHRDTAPATLVAILNEPPALSDEIPWNCNASSTARCQRSRPPATPRVANFWRIWRRSAVIWVPFRPHRLSVLAPPPAGPRRTSVKPWSAPPVPCSSRALPGEIPGCGGWPASGWLPCSYWCCC